MSTRPRRRFRRPPPSLDPDPGRARREVLAEWRGVDLAPAEKAWANAARGAAQLVPEVLQGLRLEQRRAESEIVKVWNHLLDPNIAAHAQPVKLHQGTLFVAVDSSVWLTEIVRYRSREILLRLQASFGSQRVKKISFRLG